MLDLMIFLFFVFVIVSVILSIILCKKSRDLRILGFTIKGLQVSNRHHLDRVIGLEYRLKKANDFVRPIVESVNKIQSPKPKPTTFEW